MIALLTSLTGAAGIALASWLPGLLGADSGVEQITPGLLKVSSDAVGVVTLGDGRSVSLDSSGLTVADGSQILFRTVRSGSVMSALVGSVVEDDPYRERVDEVRSNLTITDVEVEPGLARYVGTVASSEGELPATITVRVDGPEVSVTAAAKGADAVVVHGYQEPGSTGTGAALPQDSLLRRAWWLERDVSAEEVVMRASFTSGLAVGPEGVARAVDLRRPGHTDLHAWSEEIVVTAIPEEEPTAGGDGDG